MPLVGRDEERAVLADALARCRQGVGGVVLVSGDAGVGKSRLVAECVADWDGQLLRAAATAGARIYAPLADLLRDIVDSAGLDAVPRAARGLLPELGEPSDVPDAATLTAAVRQALFGAARRSPAVVVIEDLHWAEAATLELLTAVAARAAGEPLLLIGTYRSEELPRAHPVRTLRTELRRAGGVTEIELLPLGRPATAVLLAALLSAPPSDRLTSSVHERAEGLPFFVEELAAALLERGSLRQRTGVAELPPEADLPLPDSLLDAVLARTADVRREHGDAVEISAVLGVRVDLRTLAELTSPSDVDALLDAGLLTEQPGDAAAFHHSLVRDALYRSIPWGRRRSHHRRVAELSGRRGAEPALVADHWIAANEPERARPLLLTAARQCCELHAYRDAAGFSRRALAIWPDDVDPGERIVAMTGLADCAELCGEFESAVATWADVARAHRAADDHAAAGRAQRRLANAADLLGDWAGAIAAREAAVVEFTAAAEVVEVAAERITLAAKLASAAHHTRALEHAVAAAECADAVGRTDLKAHALAVQGAVRTSLGENEEGVTLAREGLELALSEQLPEAAAASYYELAGALIHAAEYAAAADAYADAAQLCRSHEINGMAQVCVACMSVAVRFLGDWDRALAIAADVLDDDSVAEVVRMIALEETGLITVLRGDRRGARNTLRRAAAFGESAGVFGIEVGATWGTAMVADLDGDQAEGQRIVAAMVQRCSKKEDWVFALPALRWSATFLALCGDRDTLASCHRVLAGAVTRNSSAKVLSALAHAGGELALLDGDAAQASAQFGRAVELLNGITVPFEHSLSRMRWGAALAKTDDRESAVEAVSTAYRTARQLGAKPLARGCAAELAAMGEQVDRRLGRIAARSLAPAGLTRREKEVLRLLAGGRTNRQIAQHLFLSTRTVDMHVRNVLGKLDCSSRLAAAQRAAELGLVAAAQ